MRSTIILTIVGSDRPGLTQSLADAVLLSGGNWLESHLARLGGKCVGSVLVDLPSDGLDTLRRHIAAIDGSGLKVDIIEAADTDTGGTRLDLAIIGADRPGIVREVSAALARLAVNIDELDTDIEDSAWSGSPLFKAQLRLRIPAGITAADVQDALEAISGEIMVDFTIAKTLTKAAANKPAS